MNYQSSFQRKTDLISKEKVKNKWRTQFIIDPQNPKLMAWELVNFSVIIIYFFYIPIEIAFSDREIGSNNYYTQYVNIDTYFS